MNISKRMLIALAVWLLAGFTVAVAVLPWLAPAVLAAAVMLNRSPSLRRPSG